MPTNSAMPSGFQFFGRHNVFRIGDQVFLNNQRVAMSLEDAVLSAQVADEAEHEQIDGYPSALYRVLGLALILIAAGSVAALGVVLWS